MGYLKLFIFGTCRGFQRKMVQSMNMAAKVPHFHYVEDINCDALVELKQSLQNNNSDPSIKFTFLPVLIKSLSVAMSKFPLLNSCFKEDSLEVILKGMAIVSFCLANSFDNSTAYIIYLRALFFPFPFPSF